MAQRGGVVTSHVRFGEKINSPAIPPGEADLMVAFEPAEASRWMDQLRPVMVLSWPTKTNKSPRLSMRACLNIRITPLPPLRNKVLSFMLLMQPKLPKI